MDSLPPHARQQLLELKRGFILQLPDRLRKIAEACELAAGAGWTEETDTNAYRLAHNLAGTSATYGLVDVSEAARRVEAPLSAAHAQRAPLSEAAWSEIRLALRDLDAVIRSLPPV